MIYYTLNIIGLMERLVVTAASGTEEEDSSEIVILFCPSY